MTFFSTIEQRTGVDEPDYRPPADVVETSPLPASARVAIFPLDWIITRIARSDAFPWIIAIIVPIVGIVWGIYWLATDKVGPGLSILFTSVLAAAIWAVVFAALELV
jgi:hypothetical protein